MAEGKKTRVLLADDEKHIRTLIKAVIAPLDCEVVAEAQNGAEAVALYKETRPDVALLDINMPVKDGAAALQEIVAFDRDAVVIMLTSIAEAAMVQSVLNLGASHYIRKDTPVTELREIVRETLDQHAHAR